MTPERTLALRDKAERLAQLLWERGHSYSDTVGEIAHALREASEAATELWAYPQGGVMYIGTGVIRLDVAKRIIARSAKGEYE
jgi:hypothetical protein